MKYISKKIKNLKISKNVTRITKEIIEGTHIVAAVSSIVSTGLIIIKDMPAEYIIIPGIYTFFSGFHSFLLKNKEKLIDYVIENEQKNLK